MTNLDPEAVRASLTGDLLADAYVEPDWDGFLNNIATLALPENWTSPGDPPGTNRVLSSLIRYTYRRATATARVGVGYGERGHVAIVFASGLYTPGLELLYCVGGPTDARQRWAVKGVETATRAARHLGAVVPAPPTYWDDSCELVLDTKADFYYDAEELVGRESVQRVLPAAIASLPETSQIALIRGAIDTARRLAELNPRIVAPAFNFRGPSGDGELTLLLPLNLASSVADAALVLKEIQTGGDDRIAYRGAAIIDIGRAYTSARLVAPLDSVWAAATSKGPELSDNAPGEPS